MIEMLKRHEVQVLRRAGHTWKAIAALSGVSVRTVRRIAATGVDYISVGALTHSPRAIDLSLELTHVGS